MTYTASCTVDPGASGTLDNTATITSGTADPNAGDNSATDSNTVLPLDYGDAPTAAQSGFAREIRLLQRRVLKRYDNTARSFYAVADRADSCFAGSLLELALGADRFYMLIDGDEKIGVDIVLGVLAAPLKQIADNAGQAGSVIADEVSQKPTNTGYDANTGEYVDMMKAGILDPTKVVKTALANAASIAGLMLTTEALVTNFDNKDEAKKAVVGSIR